MHSSITYLIQQEVMFVTAGAYARYSTRSCSIEQEVTLTTARGHV